MEGKSGNLGKIGTRLGERRSSYGNVEEMLKRKREEKGEEGESVGEGTFSRSKKTPRSPAEEREEGREWGERGKGWKEELKEMFREMREEMKEDNRQLRGELNEGRKELFRMLKMEIEELRKEEKAREERWGREKEEMRGHIRELENKVEKLMEKRGGEGAWKREKGRGRIRKK